MFKHKALNTLIIILFTLNNSSFAQSIPLIESHFDKVGRAMVNWTTKSVQIKNGFIKSKQEYQEGFLMNFAAQAPKGTEQVQIWSGFSCQNREHRYALGLRGGNNNDLYLCRYQEGAKNKMLALASIDFPIQVDKWYQISIAFIQGQIKIYLNGEKKPRINIIDPDYIGSGSLVLGGGWLPVNFKELSLRKLTKTEKLQYLNDSLPVSNIATTKEKELLRQQQRKSYKSKTIKSLKSKRTEISLKGNWLFKPEHELSNRDSAFSLELNDDSWHTLAVPGFWNPVRNWLHLEDSHLPHPGSGISDNYREKEYRRCENYSFDYKATDAAWYRHWIELPKNIEDKSIQLYFSAVSKIADIYVNGQQVGSHIGMFGDFKFEISSFLKPGKNLIAVAVKVRKTEKRTDATESVAKAVSVEVTNDMLNSLPHGMFNGTEGGIWQDVRLIITEKIRIDDVFANLNLEKGEIEIELFNQSSQTDTLSVALDIKALQTSKSIYKTNSQDLIIIEANSSKKVVIKIPNIPAKAWSPEFPNMYKLRTSLLRNQELVDEKTIETGFRTFESRNHQFMLNGTPYWLGGANHPPAGIAPNDERLANRFFELMHNGRQMATRSHGCPFTETWMKAADHQGVAVSYEGSWPWLMIGDIPSEELIEIWKAEMLALVKKYRNHPSLFIWTINNEMYFTMFYHNDPKAVRLKKWQILSDLIKAIRELSPNTLISADSGYSRLKGDFEENLKPHGIDDGDIDDRHVYFNWYNRDFFQIKDSEWAKRIYWSPGANANRPFFSQESSTGYTNNDDGHFNRKYLFNNYVPQSWVGDWAYEDKDPSYSLNRHAFMSKELLESIRRTSPESAGILLFSNVCWFQNVYDADKIKPYPIYEAIKKASSSVLISAELMGRNYYAGEPIKTKVCIINQSIHKKEWPASTLQWFLKHEGKTIASGAQNIASIPYYDRVWADLTIDLPKHLPLAKSYCQLEFSIQSEDQVYNNSYDLCLVEKSWLDLSVMDSTQLISVYDISGETYQLLDFMGIKYHKLKDLTEIRLVEADLIIVANLDQDEEVRYGWEDVKKVCGNGTNVLLIHPGKHMQWLYYHKIQSIYERKGRLVNMHIPEHPAFNEIDPMELVWWQMDSNEKPRVCRRSYRLKHKENSQNLCTYLRPHTGLSGDRSTTLFEMSGVPLIEIQEKKGRLIASEMETNQGIKDPIAAKLFLNMIIDLLK